MLPPDLFERRIRRIVWLRLKHQLRHAGRDSTRRRLGDGAVISGQSVVRLVRIGEGRGVEDEDENDEDDA